MTHTKFLEFAETIKKGEFVSIVTVTKPKLRKKAECGPCPFYGNLLRITRRVGRLGTSYENTVNNQREREDKEPDFEAEPLAWGRHKGAYFVEHNGKYYLKFSPKENFQDEWRTINPDAVINFALVQPFLVSGGESTRQGTEKPILWRTIALESLKLLKYRDDIITIESESEKGEAEDIEGKLLTV